MNLRHAGGNMGPEELVRDLALSGELSAAAAEAVTRREAAVKARELGLKVSDQELQEYADSFRKMKQLFSAHDTEGFLRDAGASVEEFEEFCEHSILLNRLKEQLASPEKLKEHFINHRTDFDRARLSYIRVKDEELANEIALQVREDGEDFHRLARKHSVHEDTRYAGGYVGKVYRGYLPADRAAKVFSADAGDLVGPYKDENGYGLILVEEVEHAQLNDEVREAVKQRIFDEWRAAVLAGGITLGE